MEIMCSKWRSILAASYNSVQPIVCYLDMSGKQLINSIVLKDVRR